MPTPSEQLDTSTKPATTELRSGSELSSSALLPGQPLTLSLNDSVSGLRELPAGSVQLVVTSPPYDALRTYGGHSWDFEGTAGELYRVVCDGGIVCWNVGDSVVDGSETLTSMRQAIHFKDVAGFRVHDTMIYEKMNFSHPERVRYHQVFEYVFVMSKGQPRCFNPLKDKKNTTAGCAGNLGVNTFTERDGSKSERSKNLTAQYGMRGNVWKGKTRGQEDMCKRLHHPAMMPKWLARDLILSWSNPGDLVADPFAGSGTTGREAIANGRRAWLNDVKAEYLKMADESCSITRGLHLAG